MSDTNSFVYRYSWDKEDLQTSPWEKTYLRGPEILTYLEQVVQRHDLEKHMTFNTEVQSAKFDADKDGLWRIETDHGALKARYFIAALGLLTQPNWPRINGLKNFKGELYHSARFPNDYDFRNKKVGVIGNGSTGVQIITAIAKDVGSLLCFQRNPQYTVPAGYRDVSKDERQRINENYDDIWNQVRASTTGMGFEDSDVSALSVSEEERERKFEAAWRLGNGVRFFRWTFNDLGTDEKANRTACEFIKKKISQIVTDPEKARKLMPRELYIRRPLCDAGYYEQFNRDNVDIVDIHGTPIDEITGKGIRLADGSFYELDVIICATGYDAVDGAYRKIEIQGRNGITLNEHWKHGATTFMGIAVTNFPNLLMVTGPQSPLGNLPPIIESYVEFITRIILTAEKNRRSRPGQASGFIEVTPEAEAEWVNECDDLMTKSIFSAAKSSFMFGRNVEGKPDSTLFYFGGLAALLEKLNDSVKSGYKGFKPL
ncbi:cyclohexanone monooxygenase [Xylogone sp. PMI_703]|nr:cyclohexanone monooxygenase [Xylogone sp. PMI_703]